MQILEDISLKELTTLRVGGNARFFVSVTSEEELEEALRFSTQQNVPVFVLGGGSNVVISDNGFDGLVIKNEIMGFEMSREGETALLTLGAGENWDEVVERTTESGLSGIENLSLIPGTVGAAPVQNIGAYGVEIKDALESVRAYDLQAGSFVELSAEECDFSYRNSVFKKGGHHVITSVSLRLRRSFEPSLTYKDIQRYLEEEGIDIASLTPKRMREIVIDIRSRKLPDPRVTPTAGSFFKNPEVRKGVYDSLKETYSEMPGFLTEGAVKIPLAWIIENICHLKGARVGGASIYSKHALVVVNEEERASAEDIAGLARTVADCVKERVGIDIEREVQFIGDF